MAAILAPASVAIIGASADRRAFGGFVLGKPLRFEWQAALHLVSRSSTEIEGRPCLPTVDDLPHGVDVAVLAIPEAGVLDAVRSLAARGCKAAVLFASGYAETGDDGRARQQALQQVAGTLALIGPNGMGYTHFEARLALTVEAIAPLATPSTSLANSGIAVIARNGFMAASAGPGLRWPARRRSPAMPRPTWPPRPRRKSPASNAPGGWTAERRRRLVSAAKALVGPLARRCGLDAIQMHGAMGMTGECRIGHLAKRLITDGVLFGDASHHLDRFRAATSTAARPASSNPH